MDFKLMDKYIYFSKEFIELNELRAKFMKLAISSADIFNEEYKETFSNIDEFSSKGEEFGIEFIAKYVSSAVDIIISYGIYTIDVKTFLNKYYLGRYYSWIDSFDEINEKYLSIKKNAAQMEEYRRLRKESRGAWQGGGFGFSGAIKGAMTAGAMNMASGLMHSTINMGGNMMTSISSSIDSSNLFNSEETQVNLENAMLNSIFNIHYAIIDVLIDNEIKTIAKYSDANKENQSNALFNNLKSGRIPEENETEVIKQIIELNPYNNEIYEFLLRQYGDKDNEIKAIGEFLGYSWINEYKYEILESYFKELNVETEEETLESKRQFINYAERLNVDSYSKYIDILNDILIEHDKKIRTVDYVEFPTREEASLAREEMQIINEAIFDIIEESEELISSAINKIKSKNLETCLKDKYLERLYARLEKAIRVADEVLINNNFDINNIREESEVEIIIDRLLSMDIRSKDLVELKRNEILEKKDSIIRENDIRYVDRVIRKYLFFKPVHIKKAIDEVSSLQLRTESVKKEKIEYLANNSEQLIADHLKKLDKARKYEQRQKEPQEVKSKKGLLSGFMSKITSTFEAITNTVEDEKRAWEFITNNGMRTLDEMDVD